MKKILYTIFTIAFFFSSFAQETTKADLVFVAEFQSYDDWLNKAFMADKNRRSGYCNEDETLYGKVSDKMALIYLNQFDMSRMGEFAGDKDMEQLMIENQISHSEVYQVVDMNPEKAPAKADLFFKISFTNFDDWYNKAFAPDSERRAQFCDEARTKMAKVDENHALVILYDFDLSRTWEFESNEEAGKLMQQFEVKHEVNLLESL